MKSIRLQKRGTDLFYDVTPEAWQKMQAKGRGEFYLEAKAPAIPKEVAAKSVTHKKLADKTTASEPHGIQTNTDRLPDEDAG